MIRDQQVPQRRSQRTFVPQSLSKFLGVLERLVGGSFGGEVFILSALADTLELNVDTELCRIQFVKLVALCEHRSEQLDDRVGRGRRDGLAEHVGRLDAQVAGQIADVNCGCRHCHLDRDHGWETE